MDLSKLIGQIICVQAQGATVTGPLKCVGGQYQVHRVLGQAERLAVAECFLCFWEGNVSSVQGNIVTLKGAV